MPKDVPTSDPTAEKQSQPRTTAMRRILEQTRAESMMAKTGPGDGLDRCIARLRRGQKAKLIAPDFKCLAKAMADRLFGASLGH